jgi:hypothetical protein
MPSGFSIDLKQLVRVLLNDPTARAEIEAALAEGPAPVRTSVAQHVELDAPWDVFMRTDRERSPGEAGFLARDAEGRFVAMMREAMQSEPDAKTISAANMAENLGISVDELSKLVSLPPEVPEDR